MFELVLLYWAAMSGCQWSEATLNAEAVSYMLDDETTPVKACGDLAYHASHCGRGFFHSIILLNLPFDLVERSSC